MSDEEQNEEVVEELSEEIRRKRAARDRGDESVWFGFGMFGLIGWSVSLPALLGLLLGIWIDNTFETGRSWTLIMLMAGVTLGCINAWYWISRERDEIHADLEDRQEDDDGD